VLAKNDLDKNILLDLFKRKIQMDQDARLRGKVISGYVQEFSVSPFYVSLYMERQLNILQRFIKLAASSVLHLDSTGTVSARLPLEYGSKQQFYYALCIRLKNAVEAPVIPVLEFISNSQMARTIAHVLHGFFHAYDEAFLFITYPKYDTNVVFSE
jgi:hypothetical protein